MPPASRCGWRSARFPSPAIGELRLRVLACAVCRTDLHVVDGDLPLHALPIVPGHEIVGEVEALGAGVMGLASAIASACPGSGIPAGIARSAPAADENLCDTPRFTGYDRDGGFASHVIAEADFCLPLGGYQSGPCAHRAADVRRIDRLAQPEGGRARRAAPGHLRLRCRRAPDRPGRRRARAAGLTPSRAPGDAEGSVIRAQTLGAVWAGGSDQTPVEPLDAAIIFAPAGDLVPIALRAVRKGGRVVCGGIHMSDIPPFPTACSGKSASSSRWPT